MHQEHNKKNTLEVLAQAGNLGTSVIDHLTSPLALADNVKKVSLFCHHPGPVIPNVEYHCPPKTLARFTFFAVIYESIDLFFRALFGRSACVAGFYLNPHGIIAFIVGKLTRKRTIISLIAGRAELYTKGTIQHIDFDTTAPPWYGRLFIRMLKHTDIIITTGSVTKNFLVRHGIKDDKIYPIISPVNRSRFFQVEAPRIYDVISVGYVYLIKHHEILLEALLEVKRNYPDIKACIVGNGPLKSKLIRFANDLGIKENVDFIGFQTDVPKYYNSSKIFVHTSETEGFPNVVLEAMRCGLPCVVSNCGDIIDIAKDGLNSLVIQKFNNYEGFAKAIINLLKDKNLYNSLSRNALETAESISIENVTHQWEQVLDNIKLQV